METDTAFVRADGIVVLYAVTHVGLDVAFVVHPGHAELIYTVRNTQPFDEVHFVEFRMFVVFFFDCAQHFFYCLMILRFIRKSSFQIFQYFCCIHKLKDYLFYLLLVTVSFGLMCQKYIFFLIYATIDKEK